MMQPDSASLKIVQGPEESRGSRAQPVPLPDNIRSVQPGGGFCYGLELAWGRWRRWWLKTIRPGYVRRMAEKRRGDAAGCPHEVLDPRDLKYCRNLCTAHWSESDDPFRWRERIPLARWGLAEVQIMGWPLVVAAALLAPTSAWPLAAVPLVLLGWVGWFFRDPRRRVPTGPGLLVSPADGLVVEITKLADDPFVGGPAVRIGIFLSIFNVHINRTPCAARVVELRYSSGKFLNAQNPQSALVNENMWIGMEEEAAPHRKFAMRQISGLIARRIVCDLRPGESLERGQKFGMIKLGSRAELILRDEPGLRIDAVVGRSLRAGESIVARYE